MYGITHNEPFYTITVLYAREGIVYTEQNDNYHDAIDRAYALRLAHVFAGITVTETESGKTTFDLRPPFVGALATLSILGDSYAGHIVKVSPSGKTIEFAHDGAERGTKATLRGDGRYRAVGGNSFTVGIGYAVDKRDPHV